MRPRLPAPTALQPTPTATPTQPWLTCRAVPLSAWPLPAVSAFRTRAAHAGSTSRSTRPFLRAVIPEMASSSGPCPRLWLATAPSPLLTVCLATTRAPAPTRSALPPSVLCSAGTCPHVADSPLSQALQHVTCTQPPPTWSPSARCRSTLPSTSSAPSTPTMTAACSPAPPAPATSGRTG